MFDTDYKTSMGESVKVKQNSETAQCFTNRNKSLISPLQQSSLEPERPFFHTAILTTQCRKPPHLVLNRVPWITQCLTIQIVTVIMQITTFHCSGSLISLEMLFNSRMLWPTAQKHQTKMNTSNHLSVTHVLPLRAGRKTMV